MKPLLEITIADGKYTLRQEENGRTHVLRYGGEVAWRDVTGDGLILALAQEIEKLRYPLIKI